MKFNSLALRLFLTSTAIALIVLVLTGFQLINQFRNTIEDNFDERLKANLSLLIESSLRESVETPKEPDQFGGFAFTLPNSGWYWQIEPIDNDQLPIFTSSSLGSERLNLITREHVTEEQDGTIKYYIEQSSGQRLRVIERLISLGTNDKPQTYAYIVSGDSSEIDDDVVDFAYMLTLSFFILGLGLILATFIQVKIGLQPLRIVESGLTDVRAGKTDKLEGDFPAEIEPLQFEINNLIKSNMNIIERARTHVGNLAHALKTPLSVINNEVNAKPGPFADKIAGQVEIMQTQISHHLDRARMAARVGIVGNITEVEPALSRLSRAIKRIYEEKSIRYAMDCPAEAKFAGEQQDFEEIIGNLLDNAFKWAKSRVTCQVSIEKPPKTAKPGGIEGNNSLIMILIEDDGPGLSEAEQSQVRKRGKRLDETVPGSGLGLSIVNDLVDLYGGQFDLGTSAMGGLSVKIQLPGGT